MKRNIVITAKLYCAEICDDLMVHATTEDGVVIASHLCSNTTFIPHDMGITSKLKHKQYDAYYPDGWQLIVGKGAS